MTSHEIKKALFDRYCMPEWATVDEVPSGILGRRRIDVLTMNLYPSKNQEIIGFEIKVSKQDLKKELADGSKSDAIAKYCDKFFLVIPKELNISDLDLPSTWGVMTFDGKALRIQAKGTIMQNTREITRDFTAAFLQAFFRERSKEIDKIARQIREDNQKKVTEMANERLKYHLENLSQDSKSLEVAAKINDIIGYYPVDEIVKAVKVAVNLVSANREFKSIPKTLGYSIERLKTIQQQIEESAKDDTNTLWY